VLLRRIVSCHLTDDQESKIDLRVENFQGQKCVMTNEQFAEVEYISKDIPTDSFTAEAAYFISLKLARLAVPLIVGTNSKTVIQSVNEMYVSALVDAQKKDSMESTIYQPEWMRSEFAKARMS
jgi:hypothetical protein